MQARTYSVGSASYPTKAHGFAVTWVRFSLVGRLRSEAQIKAVTRVKNQTRPLLSLGVARIREIYRHWMGVTILGRDLITRGENEHCLRF
jgi:hypothetical protein